MKMTQERKQYPYLGPFESPRKTRELRDFIGNSHGLRTLTSSVIQKYRDRVTGLNLDLLENPLGFVERLQRLQGVIDSGFRGAEALETAVRRLDTGIAVPFVFPNESGISVKTHYRGNCDAAIVRMDVLRTTETFFGARQQTASEKNGWQFVAAIGKVVLDRRAHVEYEVLDGVRLFINDDGAGYGLAIGFRGPGLIFLGNDVHFERKKHSQYIQEIVDAASNLSFCQKDTLR